MSFFWDNQRFKLLRSLPGPKILNKRVFVEKNLFKIVEDNKLLSEYKLLIYHISIKKTRSFVGIKSIWKTHLGWKGWTEISQEEKEGHIRSSGCSACTFVTESTKYHTWQGLEGNITLHVSDWSVHRTSVDCVLFRVRLHQPLLRHPLVLSRLLWDLVLPSCFSGLVLLTLRFQPLYARLSRVLLSLPLPAKVPPGDAVWPRRHYLWYQLHPPLRNPLLSLDSLLDMVQTKQAVRSFHPWRISVFFGVFVRTV